MKDDNLIVGFGKGALAAKNRNPNGRSENWFIKYLSESECHLSIRNLP